MVERPGDTTDTGPSSKPPRAGRVALPSHLLLKWACSTLTNWATHSGFKDILGWVVEVDGADSYVLTQGKNIIFDTKCLEDAAVHIDIMKLNLTM